MGGVLDCDADRRTVPKMTGSDVPGLFAGIVWDDIYPATSGRVETRGFVATGNALREDAAPFVMGDAFSVTAGSPGEVLKVGNDSILMAIQPDAVEVGCK